MPARTYVHVCCMCNGSDQLADIEGTKHCVDAAGDNVRRKRNVARNNSGEWGRETGEDGWAEGGGRAVASDTL